MPAQRSYKNRRIATPAPQYSQQYNFNPNPDNTQSGPACSLCEDKPFASMRNLKRHLAECHNLSQTETKNLLSHYYKEDQSVSVDEADMSSFRYMKDLILKLEAKQRC